MSSPGKSERSKRYNSPSPFRVISPRRVNQERQPLIDRPLSEYEYGSILSNNNNKYPPHIPSHLINELLSKLGSASPSPLPLADAESIIYQAPDNNSSSSSRPYIVPTNVQRIDDLPWNELLPYYLPSHVPVISGLFSLGISPLIYMIFGSVPQMIVGPEGPISLIVGQAVEPILHDSKHKKNLDPLEYVAAISFLSGMSLLGFGLGRFGFLDNVLSASLLKGFICAVGIVMNINALINCLGLEELMKEITRNPEEMDIHSPFDKVRFLWFNYKHYNPLSLKISLIGFAIIMAIRIFKKYAAKRPGKYSPKIVFIPEILLIVGCSTILCSYYRWDLLGINIIGNVKHDGELKLYNPLKLSLLKKFTTSGFLCAMLGFFESTTASKSLGSRYDLPISSNRELVALGSLNIFCSMFGALPAFGGYGRSKVNAISAKTTMLGGIMGFCTLITVVFFLDYLYYVPECMLSVVVAVIGLLLIEEAPYELYFHWKTKGYNELITFAVTVLTTLFFSMEGGIAVGLIYLLIRVIKNSTISRIQILGRYPNTNVFVDADIPTNLNEKKPGTQLNVFDDIQQMQLNEQVIEEIEGCLIIKIPEPLTFTNSSDLRARLKRVEMYGSTKAHPAQKRSRDLSMVKYIIFDLNGMQNIDSSACKILYELIINYRQRDIRTFFVRVGNSKDLRNRLKSSGINKILIKDLIDVKYFVMQNIANRFNINCRGRDHLIEMEEQELLNTNFEIENVIACHDLIESDDKPYFHHISDALRVIDCFEVNEQFLNY